MSATLLLLAALVADSSARAAPGPEEIQRMNKSLERAGQVWVVTEPAAFFVERPRATAAGLDYRPSPGPSSRPAIVAGEWDSIPEPLRPLPWSTIERIEWRHGNRRAGIIAGVLTSMALLGGVVALVNTTGSDVGPSVPAVVLGVVTGGLAAGVLVSGIAATTEVIYPAP